MRKRIRPTVKPEGIPSLISFYQVKALRLTYTGELILRGLQDFKTQKQISWDIGVTPSAVSQQVKRLVKLGLYHPPNLRKTGKILNSTARGGQEQSLNVRWRSLKWKIDTSYKWPFDVSALNSVSKVKYLTRYHKGRKVRFNIGRFNSSIEIEAGFSGGNTEQEIKRNHDALAIETYDWLVQQYPGLEVATGGRQAYEVNREGELEVAALRMFAQSEIERHGTGPILYGSPPIAKVDQSRGYPEFQLLLGNLATKGELTEIRQELKETTAALKDLTLTLKELVLGSRKPPERPGLGDYR